MVEIYKQIIINLGIVAIAILFIELAKLDVWMKQHYFGPPSKWERLRPFDCAPCLALWLTLVLLPFYGKPEFHYLFYPFINSFIFYLLPKRNY